MDEQITAGVTSSPEKKDDVVTSTTQKDDVVADSTPTPDSIDETDISNAVDDALKPEEAKDEGTEEEVKEETSEDEIEIPDFQNKTGEASRFDKTEEYKKFLKRKEEKLKEKYENEYQEKLRLEAEKLAEEKVKEKYPDIAKEKEKESFEADYNDIESEIKKFEEEETAAGAKLIRKVLEITKTKDKQIADLRAKQEQIDEKFALEASAKKAVKEADEQEEYNNFFNEYPDAVKEDSIWAKNYNNTINFVMQQKKVSPLEALDIAVKEKINIGFGTIPETIIKVNAPEKVSSKTEKLIKGAKQRIEAQPSVGDIYNGNEVVSQQEYTDAEEAVSASMDEFSSLFEDEALHQNS